MSKFDAILTEARWNYWIALPSWSASDAIFLLIGIEPDATDFDHRNFGPLFEAGSRNSAIENHFRRVGLIEGFPYLTAKHPPQRWVAEFLCIPDEELPFQLPDGWATPKVAPVERGEKWPWGEYETDLLRKLAGAADRFWRLYDPSDPSTAPTNEHVEEWLVKEGVAKRTAAIMATILRADGLRPGPRK